MKLEASGNDELFRSFGVVVAYLFGSRATQSARPDSDVDLAVLTSRPLSLHDRATLADRLRLAMKAPDVDIVVLETAPLELRGRVVQEGRVVFSADEAARVAFEVRTRSEYFDYLPTLREYTRRFLRRVADQGLQW